MKIKLVHVLSFCGATAVVIGLCADPKDTNSPVVHSQEIRAQINQQAFAEGVRFGLLAKQRNQDIMDVNVLTQIAYALFTQQQQILAQQAKAHTNAPVAVTNAAPTNATEP